METREVIAQVLASRRRVSGRYLAERLGVSRTAVWKHIESLRSLGYQIDARPREGYLLVNVPDLLLPWEIRQRAQTRLLGTSMFHYESLQSTNETARELALQGSPEGTVVVAEEQVRGKGRMGRSWLSPRSQGIWMSVILRPRLHPAQAPGVTSVAAVAVARSVEEQTGLKSEIKWPNDILVNGRKVVGILTELVGEDDQVQFVILGIGVNVNIQRDSFPKDLRDKATSLGLEAGRKIDRIELAAAILKHLELEYQSFLREGLKPTIARWKTFWRHRGNTVEVRYLDRVVRGVALDVEDDGALLLELPGGERERVRAGEVFPREGPA